MFALVDCNNFYCSCERVFRPELESRPIIVLSNNDGCAIARSEEAKQLGIQMGSPYYQIKKLIKQHNIAVFSSNYTLYSDMNKRITSILHRFAPKVEVYSVDECFLEVVIEATANFAARAASKLRRQKCCAGGITVFLHTHPFIDGEREHNPSVYIPFLTATSATSEIVRVARKAAALMFWDGIRYLKAGIILHHIVPEEAVQRSLFDHPGQRDVDNKASLIMDNINTAYGRDTLRFE